MSRLGFDPSTSKLHTKIVTVGINIAMYVIHKLKHVTHRTKKYGKLQLSVIQTICVEQEIEKKTSEHKSAFAYTAILSCCFQIILTFAQGACCFQRRSLKC